jgi:hypothetical protein
VRYTSEELREAVEREFAAPGCGWENARYIAPDIMIEADSVEAVERGDCRLVMGELHLSNTLACSVYMAQLPGLDGVRERTRKDLPERRVVPALPNSLWSQRYAYAPTLAEDARYCFGPDPSPASSHRTLNIADLVVERTTNGLRVIHRERDWDIDVIELMGLFLTMLTTNLLQILPRRRHVPRIEIDGVVVVRESWTSPVSELAFVGAKDPVDRWLGVQAWRQRLGIPRRAFVKVPVEPKPCFVDFDSPIYVEKLIRFLRVTAGAGPEHSVSLSEMVPGPDKLWLRDQEGNRYTSELRLALLDRRPA